MRVRWRPWLLPLTVVLLLMWGVLLASYHRSSPEVILQEVGRAFRVLETYYEGDFDSDRVLKGAITGILQNLDPHSEFLDERAYARMMEEQQGSFYGIGISINMVDDELTVISTLPGTPAERAGLRPGDVIAAIEGKPTRGRPIDELVRKLRGPKNTRVTITIVREGYPAPFPVTIVRDAVPLASVVNAFMTDTGVGYIRVRNFAEHTDEELKRHLTAMRAQGLRGLILDLRFNRGGLLEQAVRVADLFLPPGLQIVTVRGRGINRPMEYVSEDTDPYESIPLVVLVNRGTASASEIVAGAVQDHDRGLIVGEPTWGKGLVQTLYPLSFRTAVAITTARYYTPSGRLIQRPYVSYFEYFFPEIQALRFPTPHERFQTDLGRDVIGGGGIQPDVRVQGFQEPDAIRKLRAQDFYIFLKFARRFAPVEKAAEERRHRSTRRLLSRDFQVDDAMLEEFLAFVESRGLVVDREAFMREKVWVVKTLRRYILDALWGDQVGFRYFLTYDPQYQRALEVLPQAAQIWNRRRATMREAS